MANAHNNSAILDSMQDGFFSLDRSWRFTYLNRRAAEMLGRSPDALIGKVLWEELPGLVGTSAESTLRRTMELRTVQHVETHGTLARGWHHVTSFPTDEGVSAYWQDITECKRIKGAQLVKIAIRDDLTGAYNRYYFDTIIREYMANADRYDVPIAMALLRPDHYQDSVARLGRASGDDLIRLIAGTVGGIIRELDILVRLSDDEFGILMPHTDQFGAAETAERIREAVEKSSYPAVGPQTVSLGVADRMKAESFRHWYRRIDDSLYNANLSGPNRVAIWDRYERLPAGAVKLAWRREWETGNLVIDQQHRELMDLANQLVQTGVRRRSYRDMQFDVEALLHKVREHFRAEDENLAAGGHPEQLARLQHHRHLLNRSEWALKACSLEEVATEALVSHLLDDVVLDHLMDSDEILHYARNRI